MEDSQLTIQLSDMCDEVQRLEDIDGPLVKEVGGLESKLSELDAQLAAATPQGYYDRVLRKLECTGGDVSLLLEALSDTPAISSEAVEHGMGGASTGRYFTLQERAIPTGPAVEHPENSANTDNQSTLEAWFNLERKYGSRDGIVAHVRALENSLAQKAAQLSLVTPAKTMSRVKHKLSWVGDIALLCDALYEDPLSESTVTTEPATRLRQLVLLEAAARPRETKGSETATADAKEEKMKPKREANILVSLHHNVGRKRRAVRASSAGDLERAPPHEEAKDRQHTPHECLLLRSYMGQRGGESLW